MTFGQEFIDEGFSKFLGFGVMAFKDCYKEFFKLVMPVEWRN